MAGLLHDWGEHLSLVCAPINTSRLYDLNRVIDGSYQTAIAGLYKRKAWDWFPFHAPGLTRQ